MEQEFGMTMEELEDYEKMMWDRGDDVERFALEIYGLEEKVPVILTEIVVNVGVVNQCQNHLNLRNNHLNHL